MSEQFTQGYALLVGVGQYKDGHIRNVMQAAYDGEDLQALLSDGDYCAYPANQVELLTNQQATKSAVLAALENLAETVADKEATVILMFSGHGAHRNDTYYFLPHDTQVKTLPETAIDNETLVSKIRAISQRANKTLVIFHSCHSGSMGTPFDIGDDMDDLLTPFSLSVAPYESLAHGKGTAIFSSSQGHQLSWAFKEQNPRNSLFMDRVLAVLKGEGMAKTAQYIELLEFINTVKKSVRTIAAQYGEEQDPDYRIYGGMEGDFPIAFRLGGQSMGVDDTVTQPTIIHETNQGEKQPMSGIPSKLLRETIDVLLECGSFDSNSAISNVFVDQRISLWKNRLPSADNPAARVAAIINFLHGKSNRDGENGLLLLLHVLVDFTDPNDMCHDRLSQIARQLEQGGDSPQQAADPQAGSSSTTPRNYNTATVHELLTQVFNPNTLDRFLRDSKTAKIQDIRNNFGLGMGLNDMVDEVIDACQRFILMEQLLREVKAYNPNQYNLYANRLYRD